MRQITTRTALLTVTLALVGSSRAAAQAEPAAALRLGSLPPAEQLVRRYVEAAGLEKLAARGAVHTVGTFEMAAMGTRGEIEVIQMGPNRMVTRMTLPGLGDMRVGFDGKVGWSLNPMEGPRLLAGRELDQIRDQADFGANVRDARLVASMETVERADYGGHACYKVRVVWRSGRESFDCYDIESGLLVASQYKSVTAMGEVEAVTIYEDYKDFDGVRMPVRTTQNVFNQTLVLTIRSVTYGEVDANAFELPTEIQALVAKGN